MEQNKTNVAHEELLDELLELRQKLKEREKKKTGRTPAVCSDESIREMIRLMPKKDCILLPYLKF